MKAEYNAPTPAELDEIKHGNRNTINRLFTANYSLIVTTCKAYCRNHDIQNTLWEDMAQECYLYFEKFEFATASTFIRGVRDTCVYVRWGGERVFNQMRNGNRHGTEILTILDEPAIKEHRHGGDVETLGETIPADIDIIAEIKPPPDYCEIVHDIALKYLTPRQAQAFEYFYYTDLTAREIGQKMGININGVQSLKTGVSGYISRLRKHADELRNDLLNAGYDIAV